MQADPAHARPPARDVRRGLGDVAMYRGCLLDGGEGPGWRGQAANGGWTAPRGSIRYRKGERLRASSCVVRALRK